MQVVSTQFGFIMRTVVIPVYFFTEYVNSTVLSSPMTAQDLQYYDLSQQCVLFMKQLNKFVYVVVSA